MQNSSHQEKPAFGRDNYPGRADLRGIWRCRVGAIWKDFRAFRCRVLCDYGVIQSSSISSISEESVLVCRQQSPEIKIILQREHSRSLTEFQKWSNYSGRTSEIRFINISEAIRSNSTNMHPNPSFCVQTDLASQTRN